MRRSFAALALFLALPALAAGPKLDKSRKLAMDAQLWISTDTTEVQAGPVYAAEARKPDYEVFPPRPDDPRRMVIGYGGTFDEKGWEALQALSPKDRDQVLHRIFMWGKGMSLTIGRIPIGASDGALSRYSLDDAPGDLAMARFSFERDRKQLLPYVKAALEVNQSLRLWGAPSSPPAWMKDGGSLDGGKMKDDPKIYSAYALYLAKLVQAYKAEKITVEAVAVQDEPSTARPGPSCRWEPAQYRAFVRDHLGPTLQKQNTGARVLLGTFGQPADEAFARAVLQDEKARPFVSALGVQRDGGLAVARAARKLAPTLPVWHTDAGADPAKPRNGFEQAAALWRSMRDHFEAGTEIYMIGSLVLDETGRTLDPKQPPRSSPVVVDRKTKKVTFTPLFKAFAHWGIFAVPGDVVMRTAGTETALAFAAPNKRIVVELMNAARAERTVRVKYAEKAWDAVLPPQSFGTLIVALEP